MVRAMVILWAYGVFDSDYNKPLIYVKPGVLINNKRKPLDDNKITENVHYAWYKSAKNNIKPEEGYIEPDINKKNAYSFVKAPRYDGYAVEVGPLARMWLSNDYTRGVSTMDRTIARGLEAKKICNIIDNLLSKIKMEPTQQEKYEIPNKANGIGLKGTTRGALGHWLSIDDKKIEKYTIITPTAWNVSPTDSNGVKGVIEKALIGTYVKDVQNPVEIGRIVRSFDPCVSCATHIISDKHSSMNIKGCLIMIKVIGIGNRVMGDDGVAVYILEKIEDEIKKLNLKIEVIIGETDFLYCLNEIDDNDFVIILDSMYLGLECGTVSLLSFEESRRYLNNPETQHDIRLVDMIINYKSYVRGYIIGIEVFDVDFRLNISDPLNEIFENICNDVLNKIKIVLNTIEGGK